MQYLICIEHGDILIKKSNLQKNTLMIDHLGKNSLSKSKILPFF